MEIKGCVAIVTGGSGGLGRQVGRRLALNGANVVVAYNRSRAGAEAAAEELAALGPRAMAIQADVTDAGQIARMVEQTREEFGRLDILVNNAAVNKWVDFPDLDGLTLDVWNWIMSTNLTGPFQCIKAVAPLMKAQGQGRVVNIASIAGLQPTGSSIAYAVSKAALVHLTRCMAVATGPEVLVNCVAPGVMEGTRIAANLDPEYKAAASNRSALKRLATIDDVAEQVMAFLRSDSITGQTMVVDGGLHYH